MDTPTDPLDFQSRVALAEAATEIRHEATRRDVTPDDVSAVALNWSTNKVDRWFLAVALWDRLVARDARNDGEGR